MKALEDGGIYRPAMLILDSPILTLKEKVRKNELADPGMRASLFKYMVENCGDNQIIIAENHLSRSARGRRGWRPPGEAPPGAPSPGTLAGIAGLSSTADTSWFGTSV